MATSDVRAICVENERWYQDWNMITLWESATEDPIFTFIKKGFGLPRPRQCTPIKGGLINDTYDIDGTWVLQHVNPIFGEAVNDDIAALTPILRQGGVNVPLLCRATTGAWSLEGSDFGLKTGRWRLMTKIAGASRDHVESIEQIRALTVAIARFHGALDGCRYAFRHSRSGVHDFQRHYDNLERTLASLDYRQHRLYGDVRHLFEKIQALSRFVPFDSVMACEDLRIIHGDPKISNFMMDGDAVCGVVDLDTLARSRVAFDVGDAIRSWCNPCPEDVEPQFNREFAREMLGLYLECAPYLSRSERESLSASAPFIALELSMRFAKDALCEDYFGFNPDIGHGEHSFLRAKAMFTLCSQML